MYLYSECPWVLLDSLNLKHIVPLAALLRLINHFTVLSKQTTLIILWFSKLVASDQHGLVMLSLGYLIYVPSMCQL